MKEEHTMLSPLTKHLEDPYVLQLIEALSKQQDEIEELQGNRSAFIDDLQAACDSLHAENQVLRTALSAASDHLDYCGYGDQWERECAVEQGLEQLISEALKDESE